MQKRNNFSDRLLHCFLGFSDCELSSSELLEHVDRFSSNSSSENSTSSFNVLAISAEWSMPVDTVSLSTLEVDSKDSGKEN